MRMIQVNLLFLISIIGIASEEAIAMNNENYYREALQGIVETQGSGVLAVGIRERLLSELERPIAFGGKSGHFPAPDSDLSSGWEIIESENWSKAMVEFTIGKIDSGEAKQVYVTVVMYNDKRAKPSMTIEVRSVGGPTSAEELDKIGMSKEQLKELGVEFE